MSVSTQIEEMFMLALGSLSGLCHTSRMVAMEMTVNFYKYNTALYKILINKPLEQCAASLIHMNQDWVAAHESLKTKEKSGWVITISGRGQFFYKVWVTVQTGFHKGIL